MPQYVQASYPGYDSGTITNGCNEAASAVAGSAVVFDLWTYLVTDGKVGCWRVTGLPIPIEGSYACQQAGFEIFNKNMQAPGTAIPLPINISLQDPIMGNIVGIV